MSSRYRDAVYDRNSPAMQNRLSGAGGPDDPYVSSRGFSSNEERLTSLALASALDTPSDVLRTNTPTRGPLFPPRFVGERTQPTIYQVLDQDRSYPDASGLRSGQGDAGGYGSSSTPSNGSGQIFG